MGPNQEKVKKQKKKSEKEIEKAKKIGKIKMRKKRNPGHNLKGLSNPTVVSQLAESH